MNAKTITYWISTVLVAGMMLVSAYLYLSHSPDMVKKIAELGYPDYFPVILGVAKILGALALVVPSFAIIKEWAYAGFTITFLSAAVSHYEMGQIKEIVGPLIALAVLAVSYWTRPDNRRVTSDSGRLKIGHAG